MPDGLPAFPANLWWTMPTRRNAEIKGEYSLCASKHSSLVLGLTLTSSASLNAQCSAADHLNVLVVDAPMRTAVCCCPVYSPARMFCRFIPPGFEDKELRQIKGAQEEESTTVEVMGQTDATYAGRRYSSSVTCSYQSAMVPSGRAPCMEMWLNT